MLAIIYLEVCDLTVGNLKISEKDLIWIISVWIGKKNLSGSNTKGNKIFSRDGRYAIC
jgi:hypothetical protein